MVFQTQIINTNLGTVLKYSFMIILNTSATKLNYVFYCRHVKASKDLNAYYFIKNYFPGEGGGRGDPDGEYT